MEESKLQQSTVAQAEVKIKNETEPAMKSEKEGDAKLEAEQLAEPAILSPELDIKNKMLQSYALNGRDITPEQIAVLKVFSRGISAATPEAANEAARQLNSLCPSLGHTEEANDWLHMVWLVMLDIVADLASTDEMQEHLVRILEKLVQCAKGTVEVWGKEKRVWTDLPVLRIAFQPYWSIDPTMKWDARTLDPGAVQSWNHISSFAARLMRSGLAGDYDQAIIALRTALEEDMNTLPGFADCKIQVACLWIEHAGKFLLRWALENAGREDVVEAPRAFMEAGALYKGPSTMCPQRWCFWMDRMEQLGKEESALEERTREMALQAARTMRMVEKGVGHTLSA